MNYCRGLLREGELPAIENPPHAQNKSGADLNEASGKDILIFMPSIQPSRPHLSI